MKTTPSLQTTRDALHDFLHCLCLWVLFAGLPVAVLGQAYYATPYTFITLAGNNGYVGADGSGSAARFFYPQGVALDSAGNLYVADTANDTIRKGFPANTVPAPILQPPSLSSGPFGFAITGLPGLAVDIESSGDLSQWQFVGTYILEAGTNHIVSPNPPQGTRFYRSHVR